MLNKAEEEIDVHKCMVCHSVIHGLERFISHGRTCTWDNYMGAHNSSVNPPPPFLRPLGMPSPDGSYWSSTTHSHLSNDEDDDSDIDKINEDLRNFFSSLTEDEEDVNKATKETVGSGKVLPKNNRTLGVVDGCGGNQSSTFKEENGGVGCERCPTPHEDVVNDKRRLPLEEARRRDVKKLGEAHLTGNGASGIGVRLRPRCNRLAKNSSANRNSYTVTDCVGKSTEGTAPLEGVPAPFGEGSEVGAIDCGKEDFALGRKFTSGGIGDVLEHLSPVESGHVEVVGDAVDVGTSGADEDCGEGVMYARRGRGFGRKGGRTRGGIRRGLGRGKRSCRSESGTGSHPKSGVKSGASKVSSTGGGVVEKRVIYPPFDYEQKTTNFGAGKSDSGVKYSGRKRRYPETEVTVSTAELETEQYRGKTSERLVKFRAGKSVFDGDSSSGEVGGLPAVGACARSRKPKSVIVEEEYSESLSFSGERTRKVDAVSGVENSDVSDCWDDFLEVLEGMRSTNRYSWSRQKQSVGRTPSRDKRTHKAGKGESQQTVKENLSNSRNTLSQDSPFRDPKIRRCRRSVQMGDVSKGSCVAAETSTVDENRRGTRRPGKKDVAPPGKRTLDDSRNGRGSRNLVCVGTSRSCLETLRTFVQKNGGPGGFGSDASVPGGASPTGTKTEDGSSLSPLGSAPKCEDGENFHVQEPTGNRPSSSTDDAVIADSRITNGTDSRHREQPIGDFGDKSGGHRRERDRGKPRKKKRGGRSAWETRKVARKPASSGGDKESGSEPAIILVNKGPSSRGKSDGESSPQRPVPPAMKEGLNSLGSESNDGVTSDPVGNSMPSGRDKSADSHASAEESDLEEVEILWQQKVAGNGKSESVSNLITSCVDNELSNDSCAVLESISRASDVVELDGENSFSRDVTEPSARKRKNSDAGPDAHLRCNVRRSDEDSTSQFVIQDIRSLPSSTWEDPAVSKGDNSKVIQDYYVSRGIFSDYAKERRSVVSDWLVMTCGENYRGAIQAGTFQKSPLRKRCNVEQEVVDVSSDSSSIILDESEVSCSNLRKELSLGVRCDATEFPGGKDAERPMTSRGKIWSSQERNSRGSLEDNAPTSTFVSVVESGPVDNNKLDPEGIISVDIFRNLQLLKPLFSKMGNSIDLAPGINGGVTQSLIIHPKKKDECEQKSEMIRVDYNKCDSNPACKCMCQREVELDPPSDGIGQQASHSDSDSVNDHLCLLTESQDPSAIDHTWECYLNPEECRCDFDKTVIEVDECSGDVSEFDGSSKTPSEEGCDLSFSDNLIQAKQAKSLILQPVSSDRCSISNASENVDLNQPQKTLDRPCIQEMQAVSVILQPLSSERCSFSNASENKDLNRPRKTLNRPSCRRSVSESVRDALMPLLEATDLPNVEDCASDNPKQKSCMNSCEEPPNLRRRSQRRSIYVDRLTYYKDWPMKRRLNREGKNRTKKRLRHGDGYISDYAAPFDVDSEVENVTNFSRKRGRSKHRYRRRKEKKPLVHSDGYVTDSYSCMEDMMDGSESPLKRAISMCSLELLGKVKVEDGSVGEKASRSRKKDLPVVRELPFRRCKSKTWLNFF